MLNQRIQHIMGASNYANYSSVDEYIKGEDTPLVAAEGEEEGEEGLDAAIVEEHISEEDDRANLMAQSAEDKSDSAESTFYQKYQPLIMLTIGAAVVYYFLKMRK